jgi:hypothetical protein
VPLVAACALLVAGFVTVRTMKYVDVAGSWGARDPHPIAAFLSAHVPPGSIVYSRVPGFFYAVEQAGAAYRSYPRLFPESWLDRVETTVAVAAMHADRRYLLWPTDRSRFPMPPEFQCVDRAAAATLQPAASTPVRSAIVKLARTSLYEPVALYALPPGCGPDALEDDVARR